MATSVRDRAVVPESVSFTADHLRIQMSDRSEVLTPLERFPRLQSASEVERAHWVWIGDREGVRWPEIDEDISVHNLLRTSPKLSSPAYQVPFLVADLFRTAHQLKRVSPGRPFTPEGHLFGSIGEIVAQHVYGLVLEESASSRIDARTEDGKAVQIKLAGDHTEAYSFAWSRSLETSTADLLLCLRFNGFGFAEIYNGAFPVDLLRAREVGPGGLVELRVNDLKEQNRSLLPQLNPFDEFNRNFHRELDSAA